MDMMRLSALAIVGALCAVMVKQKTPDIAMALALCSCGLLAAATLPAVMEIWRLLEELSRAAQVSPEILTPVLKTVGIAIVTKLSSALCQDAGEAGIAGFVDLAGAAAAILVALPLLRLVLEMIGGLL